VTLLSDGNCYRNPAKMNCGEIRYKIASDDEGPEAKA
jgi:hypothetical protein